MSTFSANDPASPGFYPPNQTAFLLLDFHTLFISHAGINGPDAVTAATKFRGWAKSQGFHIIHCLLDLNQEPPPTSKSRDRTKAIARATLQGGAEEVSSLTEDMGPNERTFTRRPGCISALKSPGLLEYLREEGIKSLILSGFSTSGCVLRTAVPATDAEFVVTVLSDACADSKAGVHEFLVSQILPSRGYVSTTEEFQQEYNQVKKSIGS